MLQRKKTLALRIFAALVFPALLFGCICSRDQRPGPSAAEGKSSGDAERQKVVNLYIWSDYTSPSVLQEFEKLTGLKVQESNFSSNEELLAKLQAGASGYDLIIPSDYMVSAMVKLNLLDPLDKSKVPNAANLNPKLMHREYDPENQYSLPYAWGVSGLAYNNTKVKGPITSWADLLAAPQLKQRFSMLDDGREALSAALRINGFSINSIDKSQLDKAKQTLIGIKKNLKSFTSTPLPSLVAGELLAAHMYSNEAFMAREKTKGQISFVFPKEGGVRNIDNFAIPKGALNVEGAHKLINFLLSDKPHADFVNRMYVGPVLTTVGPLLSKDMQANPLVANFDFIAEKSEMLRDLGDNMVLFDRIWTEVKASR